MEKNVLSNIPGIEYYPIVALVLFLACFGSVIVWYFLANRTKLAAIAAEALEDARPASNIYHTNSHATNA